MSSLQRKIDVLKQEIIDNTRAVKQTMAMSFNEIRDRLNKKEEELMTNADLFMTEQVGQLDMYVTSTRDKVCSAFATYCSYFMVFRFKCLKQCLE